MDFKAKQFIDFESHKIYIDRAFQRKACWSDKTCRDFILSANKGRAPYPIIVADVTSGLAIIHARQASRTMGWARCLWGHSSKLLPKPNCCSWACYPM